MASGAIAAAALIFATSGKVVPIVQSSFDSMSLNAAEVLSASRSDAPAPSNAPPATVAVQAPAVNVTTDSAVAVNAAPDATAPAEATSEIAAGNDSSATWEEVKATTWVNVRADRKRDASILAVLNPDDVVRLGAREAGWRPVNVAGATGWVDASHFTPASRQ